MRNPSYNDGAGGNADGLAVAGRTTIRPYIPPLRRIQIPFPSICFFSLRQPLAAFIGQAVFLQAAVGLVGDGHFNQPIRQGRS